jgi:hypothetical protein
MSKRPSLLANLDMEVGRGPEQPESSVAEVSKQAMTPKTGNVKTSLYLPPQAHRKLKEIALATDCKVHDIVIEGINKMLASHGYPTVSELAKK